MDWLFRSSFDPATTFAVWSIVAVSVTTLMLFIYTVGLRLATMLAARRRDRFVAVWRRVIARAVMSADAAEEMPLRTLHQSDLINLLEEWNRTRSIVTGKAVNNLITLASRLHIPQHARTLFGRRRLQSRILAVQTLGHLRDDQHWDAVRELIADDNVALSITAAEAIVEINAARGVGIVIPLIAERRDWPKNRVSIFLRNAGSELISEPLFRAIRNASDGDRSYLLQFAYLIEAEAQDMLLAELLHDSNSPSVLNAALKLASGSANVSRIAKLAEHEAWFVRMQTAKVLGRIGEPAHLPALEAMLDDQEWWVRYRAAQAIVSLPFVGPNELRQLQFRQRDRYARDIMEQAFAEVGLA